MINLYLIIMDLNNFPNDLIGKAGGILIVDKIDNNKVILLGKSNIPKRADAYESFGGKYEKTDLSSLHTALRELIEEFFNYKIDTINLNKIALDFRTNNYILKQHELHGMSYLINFQGLNFIFQKISSIYSQLQKYSVDNKFDINKYISERIVTDPAYDGLNEIHKIEVFKIDDVKNKKINLRWFTSKIISIMVD